MVRDGVLLSNNKQMTNLITIKAFLPVFLLTQVCPLLLFVALYSCTLQCAEYLLLSPVCSANELLKLSRLLLLLTAFCCEQWFACCCGYDRFRYAERSSPEAVRRYRWRPMIGYSYANWSSPIYLAANWGSRHFLVSSFRKSLVGAPLAS